MNEFRSEVDQQSDRMEDEFGDLMFALINYARFIEINPEDVLEKPQKVYKKVHAY